MLTYLLIFMLVPTLVWGEGIKEQIAESPMAIMGGEWTVIERDWYYLSELIDIPISPNYIELEKDLIIMPPDKTDEFGNVYTSWSMKFPKGTRIYYR